MGQRLYGVFEIHLTNGLPSGVSMADVEEKINTALWGSVVPVLGIDAEEKESMECSLHVHSSTYDRSCDACRSFADNEES